MQPTLADFTSWVYTVMGVPTAALPPGSASFGYAFNVALATVSLNIQLSSPLIYQLAVYNLGGSLLLNWAPDQPGQTYFADIRKTWNLNAPSSGVVRFAGDQGTDVTVEVLESLKNLTISQIQNFKDPYGRQYLAWAQTWNSPWGIS